jgi:beta-galactosidase
MNIMKIVLKTLYLLLCVLISCLLYVSLYAANIKIVGRQMLVDGKPFTVKGVNYRYTPVGEGFMQYDLTTHPEIYRPDFALIRAMGVNTIRLHQEVKDTAFLDAAYEYGLYVIITITVSWGDNLATTAARDKVLADVTKYVSRWKDHPAILMWVVGNEINYWNKVTAKSDWYSLLNECARKAHEIEGANYHPVATAEAELADLGEKANLSDDASMPDLDLWAIQTYRGATPGFAVLFNEYKSKSTKPFVITEFGCDAYNTRTQAEDEISQAETIRDELNTIHSHLSAQDTDEACIGACIFKMCDDWSMNQWGYPNSVHDTVGTWYSQNYYDFESTATNNMNEEWWGLCAVSPGTDEKIPRQAYYEVRAKWAPALTSTTSIADVFSTEVTNYPNPFNPDTGATTIGFSVAPGTVVKVKIFDLTGRLVKVLKENRTEDNYTKYELVWDGKDSDGRTVSNGVYICFVEANGTKGTEVKYRKILALK